MRAVAAKAVLQDRWSFTQWGWVQVVKGASKILCALAARSEDAAVRLALYATVYLQRLQDFQKQQRPEQPPDHKAMGMACRCLQLLLCVWAG